VGDVAPSFQYIVGPEYSPVIKATAFVNPTNPQLSGNHHEISKSYIITCFFYVKAPFPHGFSMASTDRKTGQKTIDPTGPTGSNRAIPDHPRIIPGSLPPSGFGSPISSPPGWGPRAPGPGIAYSMVPRSPISLCFFLGLNFL